MTAGDNPTVSVEFRILVKLFDMGGEDRAFTRFTLLVAGLTEFVLRLELAVFANSDELFTTLFTLLLIWLQATDGLLTLGGLVVLVTAARVLRARAFA